MGAKFDALLWKIREKDSWSQGNQWVQWNQWPWVGSQGNQWYQWYQGNQWYQGAFGNQWYQWQTGAGSQWIQGNQWNQWPSNWPVWPQGFQGTQGNQWDKWSQGNQGNQWNQSSVAWSQGNQWFQWYQGFQWFQWVQGNQGNQWNQSSVAWSQGNQWFQWNQWNQGNQGNTQTGALPLAWGTMTWNIALWENTWIALYPTGSADEKWSWITCTWIAWATIAVWDLIYLDATAWEWLLADANAAATAGDVPLWLCILAANNAEATNILLIWTMRSAAFPASIDLWAPVYVSTTAGDIQAAKPSWTDDVVRRVWRAITTEPNTIYFNPSNDYATII